MTDIQATSANLNAKRKAAFKEILEAIVWLLVCSTAAAFISGSFWASVDWLRKFASGYQPPPFVANPYSHQFVEGSLLAVVENFIDWYNATFQMAARFGSGIGLFFGVVYSWGRIKTSSLPARALTGIISGALMGGRGVLMITSDARYFLGGAVIGAILCTAYLIYDGRRRLPPLPRIELGNRNQFNSYDTGTTATAET